MAREKVWAVAVESDLAGYVEAPSEEAAIERWRDENRIHVDYLPDDLVYAIPAEAVLDDVEVPGYLLSAVEYGAEFAGIEPGTPEWDELQGIERELGGYVPLSWLRVDSVWDLWVPVVDTRARGCSSPSSLWPEGKTPSRPRGRRGARSAGGR